MRHRCAVSLEKLPGDTPFVRAEFRCAAGKLYGCGIKVRKAALRIGRVNSNREGLQNFAENRFS
jgi:hypothetical protein